MNSPSFPRKEVDREGHSWASAATVLLDRCLLTPESEKKWKAAIAASTQRNAGDHVSWLAPFLYVGRWRFLYLIIMSVVLLVGFFWNLLRLRSSVSQFKAIFASAQGRRPDLPLFTDPSWGRHVADALHLKLRFLAGCSQLTSLTLGTSFFPGHGETAIATSHPRGSMRRLTLDTLFDCASEPLPCFESEEHCERSSLALDAAEAALDETQVRAQAQSSKKKVSKQEKEEEDEVVQEEASSEVNYSLIRGSFGEFLERSVAGPDTESWLHGEVLFGTALPIDHLDALRAEARLSAAAAAAAANSRKKSDDAGAKTPQELALEKARLSLGEMHCPSNEAWRKAAVEAGYKRILRAWAFATSSNSK
jgi:hypothetical protein